MIIKTGIISKVAFSIMGIDIYWYAILIATAIIIGFIWSKLHNGRYNINFDDILNLSLFMIPIAILSARLYYIIFNLDYYINNPSQIFNFRNGGIAIYGALIGGVITILFFCKIKKIKILNLLDYLAPIIPLGQAIGRIGNYINIEAYGTETNWPIKMEIIEHEVTKYVHPTFLYEATGNIILFFILLYLSKKRKFPGQIVYLYFMGYSFIRFFTEALRTDSLMVINIKVSQLLSIFIFISMIIVYALQTYINNSKNKKIEQIKIKSND